MKPVYQTRFKEQGNCWAACLASLFEVPLSEVDHCAGNHSDWNEQTDQWLAERGFFYIELTLAKAVGAYTNFPDGAFFIGGLISENGLNHAVIVQTRLGNVTPEGTPIEFHVVHDPAHEELNESYALDTVILICHLTRG